jgi:hypothetical protein
VVRSPLCYQIRQKSKHVSLRLSLPCFDQTYCLLWLCCITKQHLIVILKGTNKLLQILNTGHWAFLNHNHKPLMSGYCLASNFASNCWSHQYNDNAVAYSGSQVTLVSCVILCFFFSVVNIHESWIYLGNSHCNVMKGLKPFLRIDHKIVPSSLQVVLIEWSTKNRFLTFIVDRQIKNGPRVAVWPSPPYFCCPENRGIFWIHTDTLRYPPVIETVQSGRPDVLYSLNEWRESLLASGGEGNSQTSHLSRRVQGANSPPQKNK